ncbi:hypothetical protein [Photobacterium alginatilyticum]|uniref:hypothetical protein n=1 Tax=Photobacterium alginatilyticum TaxID=1775171 RepID=UPI0018656F88|nr:hypothetical protein [Photobacterium alginatilyticum]
MDKLKQITSELGKEVDKAKGSMMAGKIMAPLRLVLAWMNGVNEKLSELEQRGKHG